MATENPYEAMIAVVVDDQSFMRKVIITALRQLGITNVQEAADGAEGLKAVEQINPSFVICDIEMKPIDGLVFLQTLRASERGKTVPVIFLTQHSESSVVTRARDLGVDGFLLKPPSVQKIKSRLDQILAN